MNEVILNFLNSKNKYSVQNEGYLVNKEKNIAEPSFVRDKLIIKNNYLSKIYSSFFEDKKTDDTDYKSIKKLENNIIETFTFLKNNKLIPTLCPQKINFRFLRDNYVEQKQHKEEQLKDKNNIDKKFEQYADSKLKDPTVNNEPIINISTEHIKLHVKLNKELNGKFLNSLRNNFSTLSFLNISTNNSNKIITDLVVLHELGHFLSTEKTRGTLITRSHRDTSEENNFPIVKKYMNTNNEQKEIEINHIKNLSRNILEGFSDCFSTYLTQQHFLDNDIIIQYAQSRKETSKISTNTIQHYDLSDIFNSISKLQPKHIDLLINDFFNIAIKNSISITKKLIDTTPTFEKELKSQFEYYCKDLNIQLNLNKSLIENIEEQLKKASLSIPTLNNLNQINLNIHQIRNNSINNNSNNNNIKP